MTASTRRSLIKDIGIVLVSIIVAVILVKTQALTAVLMSTKEIGFLGSFVAGVLFTSVFTTAPAIVALAELAQANSLLHVALFGATGAMFGDLIIFRFVRDRLGEHLTAMIKHQIAGNKIKFRHHLKLFRWATFVVGGIIIASPLPDEIGIGLLGIAKMKMKWFIPLSFIFNLLGIWLIGAVALAI